MKYLVTLTLGVCVLFASMPIKADQADDELAVRKALGMLQATWDSKDLHAHLELYDANMIPWRCRDRAEYEKLLERSFEEQKNARADWSNEIGITFLTSNVAIYRANVEFYGWVDKDGRTLPSLAVLGAWVMVKRDDRWLLAAYFDRPIDQ